MANVGDLFVQIGANMEQFEKSMKQIEKRMREVEKTLANSGKGIQDGFKENFSGLGESFDEASKYTRRFRDDMDKLSKGEIARLPEHMRDFAGDLKKTQNEFKKMASGSTASLKDIQKAVLETRVGLDKMTSVSDSGKKAVKTIQDMEAATKKTRLALMGLNEDGTKAISTEESQNQMDAYKDDVNEARRALEKLRDAGDFGSYEAGMKALNKQMREVERTMNNVANGGRGLTDELAQMGIVTEGFANRTAVAMETMKDSMIHANDVLQATSTQSSKLLDNVDKYGNKFRVLDDVFLGMGNHLETLAKKGSALNVALKLAGPQASFHDINKQMQLINRGIMRWQQLSIGMGILVAGLTVGVYKMSEAVDGRLGEAIDRFKKTWLDALTPFLKMWTTIATAIVDAGTAIGQAAADFGKLHPVLSALAGMFAFLLPIVTLIASPIAIMGLAGEGAAVAFGVLMTVIGDFVIGLLAVLGPAILITAAVVALGYAAYEMYTHWEGFNKYLDDNRWAALALKVSGVGQMLYIAVAAVKAVQNALSPAIEQVDLFGEGVSKGTKKALGGFMDLSTKAQEQLNLLAWGSQTITKANSETLIATYGRMTDTIVNNLAKRKEDVITHMTGIFAKSNALSAEEEAKAIEKTKTGYDKIAQTTEESEARIKEIINTAKGEKRALKESEIAEIQQLTDQMNSTAIDTMTKNQAEQKVILETMKQNASEITAAQAAEVVANSTKQRDAVIKDANTTYTETVADIIKMRDETGAISEEQADKLIAEATKTKDETVKKANETHTDVVSAAKKQAGEHVDAVDWETGEVLTKYEVWRRETNKKADQMVADMGKKWTKLKDDTVKKFNDTKTKALEKWENLKKSMSDKTEEIKKSVTDKFENMKTKAAEKFESIRSKASEKFTAAKKAITDPIEKAKDKVGDLIDDIKGFFTNLKLKIPKPSLPSMPTFSLKTGSKEIAGKTIKYPTGIGVKWNAKGGIMPKNMIAGNQGFSEKGLEAALPLQNRRYMKPFSTAVAQHLEKLSSGNQGGGTSIENVFHIAELVVREESDVRKIALELEKIQNRNIRAKGGIVNA